MKLLVTGGAGFIGSHLLELLNSDKNYEVVVLDNLSSGFRENVPQGMRLVVADIRSQKIETLFQKENFDAVVHLAAQTMVPYSIEHPDEDCEINLAGLINVLENCRKYKVKTVLFASSAAVYGNNENVPLHEDLALMPMSFYGITKMTQSIIYVFTTSFMVSIQLFFVLRMFTANVRGKAAKVVSSVFFVNFWQQEKL